MVKALRQAWTWWYRTDWAVATTVFLLALIPRLVPSGMFMDPDSAAEWLPRTRGFLEALRGGDPKLFAPDIHPGVTLMWLTSLGFGLWRFFGSMLPGDVVESFAWVIKIPVAVTTSVLVVIVWTWLRQLIDRSTAVVVTLIFALDPLYLVFSRYLHLDALVTGFVFTGLIGVVVWGTTGRNTALLFASILLALGVLTRFNGLVAAMVGFGAVIWWATKRKQQKSIAWFILAGFGTVILVWPAILFGPAGIIHLINNRIGLALVPHEVPPMVDIIPWVRALLYPIFIVTREFPLIIFSALIGLATWRTWPVTTRRVGLVVAIFSVVYYGALLVLPKDLDRYALPFVGPLALFSGRGLQWTWQRFRRPYGRAVLIVIAVAQLVGIYRLGPYFQTYQNFITPLLRHSPVRTSQALEPAWGEGISEAVAYLKDGRPTLPPTAAWFAGVVCFYGHERIAGKYPISGTTRLDCPAGLRLLERPSEAEYLLLSRDQIKQRIYPRLLDDIERLGWKPEKVISINDVPFIFLYRNQGGLAEHYSLTGE